MIEINQRSPKFQFEILKEKMVSKKVTIDGKMFMLHCRIFSIFKSINPNLLFYLNIFNYSH